MVSLTLSEGDKRLLLVIFLAIIILIFLIAAIGYTIRRIMRAQGKRLDNYVYDVVVLGIITEEKQFKSYARRKNLQLFLKQAWIPLLIILAGFIVLVIKAIIDSGFTYNPFSKDDGFLTLLWVWDFGNPDYYNEFFGMQLLSKWPAALNNPHFDPNAWAGYISVPCFVVGAIWYILIVQGFFARIYRQRVLLKKTFGKDLSEFNVNKGFENQQPNQNVNNNIQQ